MEFYHVTYRNLSSFKTFEYRDFEKSIQPLDRPGFFSAEEYENTIKRLYRRGISTHAEFYLQSDYLVPGLFGTSILRHSFFIEATFEMVRQGKFPNEPSRFESAFACVSLEEAMSLIRKLRNQSCDIYKVSSPNYQIRDMSFLVLGRNIVSNLILAEKYWQGNRSERSDLEVLMQPPITLIGKCAL